MARCTLLALASVLGLSVVGAQAVTLQPGDLLVAGVSYPGSAGDCDGALCHIDRATGAATPIAPLGGSAAGIARDGAGGVFVTLSSGDLVRVDLASGAVEPIASGLSNPEQVVVRGGRAFVEIQGGIVAVDVASGAVTSLGAGSGLALAADGSLVTSQFVPDFIFGNSELFVLDPGGGGATPLGDAFGSVVTDRIVIAADGGRYSLGSGLWDHAVTRSSGSPGGFELYWADSDAFPSDLAVDVDGNLIIGGDSNPIFTTRAELLRIDVQTGAVTPLFDLDFSVLAFTVVPEPGTALLVGCGVLLVGAARRSRRA